MGKVVKSLAVALSVFFSSVSLSQDGGTSETKGGCVQVAPSIIVCIKCTTRRCEVDVL